MPIHISLIFRKMDYFIYRDLTHYTFTHPHYVNNLWNIVIWNTVFKRWLYIVRLMLKWSMSKHKMADSPRTFICNNRFLLAVLPELRSSDVVGGQNSKKKSIFTNKCARKVVEKLGESAILCFDIDHFNINLTNAYSN